MNFKVVDNFVFQKLTAEEARALYDKTTLYVLYDDDSESLLESREHITDDLDYGIEIGDLEDIIVNKYLVNGIEIVDVKY